jgi:pectate lyase
MTLIRTVLMAAALLGASAHAQGVVGKPFGFAAGTTGGGNAAPAAPSDIKELAQWLSDDTPRVILIDKEFDFTGSEGTCADCACCVPSSNTCGSSGQNAIETSFGWCGSSPNVTCTYDKAGTKGMDVGSDKSIVGVGSAGVIRGKGLRLTGGASNVIIQNIHITDINPEYIWGGDAISLDGTDKIWIDHVKISLVGRQMFVTGYESSGSVTISNSEFDGRTSWSASCDGHHYWTLLGLGKNEQITFARNYIHHTSGRSPKLGESSYWHAYNNYWSDNSGHAFDVESAGKSLIEGNVFSNVKTPLTKENLDGVFAVSADDESTCSGSLGRSCIPNVLTSSGELSSAGDGVFSGWLSDEGDLSLMPASQVASYVKAHAGVGKLGAGDYSSSAIPSSTPAPSSSALAKRHGGHDRHGLGHIPHLTEAGPGAWHTPGPAPSWSWRTIGVRSTALPTPSPSSSSCAIGKPTAGPPRFPIFGDLGIF